MKIVILDAKTIDTLESSIKLALRIKPEMKNYNQEVYIHELGMSEAEYTALVQGGIT